MSEIPKRTAAGSVWLLVLLALAGLSQMAEAVAASAKREVPNFNLLDLRGVNHELYRAEAKVVVLFFTGTGCPIARKSARTLRELRDAYAKQGVSFWLINTFAEDSVRDAAKEFRDLGLQGFPYLRDPRQGVALSLGVQRTAEVVAIETGDWEVVYQGAIDDRFAEGAEKPSPRERFLADALDAHLAGRPVATDRTQARGCRIAFAEVASEGGTPSYAADVAPILRKHCVECHRDGAIGPWSMDGHGRVKNYSRMIEEVLLTRRMPPWDPDPNVGKFANAHELTGKEAQTLQRWISAGAPRGEGADPLAEPLDPLPDWALGTPDVVLRLPKPEEVPATGVLEYRHVSIPNPFTNEVWVAATDIKPGNRKVVHHAILYVKWPGGQDDGTGNGLHFCGWAPGTPPSQYPPGVAKRLPAGAQLTLEMHYTTTGVAQTDQTEVAFYLAPGPQPRTVEVRRAEDFNLEIPPGSDEARHSATYAFRKPATIYSLAPHMHVRGKWMRYELLLPDGRRESLLNVPRYDFNWQLGYGLAQPRKVPAGSWLLVTGAFDNSSRNPSNPDPTQRVRFGLQSWEEMFIGFFEAADEPEAEVSTAALVP
ncbi:MAG: redoxin domain-containing protein [Limisphaerales bacterium]